MSEPTEDQVATYLARHPEFFQRHPDLLGRLRLPGPQGAVSLVERQLEILRRQAAEARAQAAELMEVAAANYRTQEKLHRLGLDLTDCRSLGDVSRVLEQRLPEEFTADAVSLHLFQDLPEAEDWQTRLFHEVLEEQRPLAGPLPDDQRRYLFGDPGGNVASVVLLPVRGRTTRGLLAIGSRDPDRFRADHAYDLLMHLAESLAHHLDRLDG